MSPESTSDNGTATTLAEVCRSCLSIETNTTPLTGELETLFSLINGFKVRQWEPCSVCYLCLAVLVKFKKYKDRCRRVSEILKDMVAEGKLNITKIKTLNRVKLGLDSLTKAQNVNNTIDFYPILFDPIKQEIDDKDADISNISQSFNDIEKSVEKELNNDICKSQTELNSSNDIVAKKNHSEKTIETNENELDCFYEDDLDFLEDTDSDVDLKTLKINTDKKTNKKKIKLNKPPKDKTNRGNAKRNETKIKKNEKDKKVKKNKESVNENKECDKKKVSYDDIKKAHEIFKENFKIYKFDLDEQIKEFNLRKESPAYLERPFKCDVCFKGFHMASAYKKHMVLHEEKTPHYCSICRLYFKTTRNYKVHKHQHEHRYTCAHCDFVSDRRSSASTHVKSHSGNIHRCSQCGREFKHRTTYANHVRVAHPSPFACADCGYTFVSEAGREQHIALAHKRRAAIPKDGPECVECKIKFSNQNALAVHVGISHPDKSSTKGKVKYINDSYKNTIQLTKYKFRKKDKPMDIVCEKCGEHFRTNLQYHWHFTKKHPNEIRTQCQQKSVLCDLCGKTLKSELHLKYHMEDHNKTLITKCDQCPKTFSNRFAFYRHKYAHKNAGQIKANGQRHMCSQCGVTFSSYSNKHRHMKIVHSNERHHFCEYCNKAFKSDPEKKTHIEHVHFKKPWPKRSRGRAKTAHDDGPSDWPTS